MAACGLPGIQQGQGKAGQTFDKQCDHLVGAAQGAGIEHQGAGLRIVPDPHAAPHW